jgi:hypothetical protein
MRIRAVDRRHLMKEEFLMSFDTILTSTPHHNDETRISIHFWSIMASDDDHLCQQQLEMTLPVPTSNLTWPRAEAKKYEIGTFVAGLWPRVELQRYKGLPLLSNGYSRVHIRSMVQEICFIEIDKHCWNSVLDRLEWTDYFKKITKIRNENSRKLNTKCIDVFIRSLMNISMPHSNKQSNGHGHSKTTRGKLLTEI